MYALTDFLNFKMYYHSQNKNTCHVCVSESCQMKSYKDVTWRLNKNQTHSKIFFAMRYVLLGSVYWKSLINEQFIFYLLTLI